MVTQLVPSLEFFLIFDENGNISLHELLFMENAQGKVTTSCELGVNFYGGGWSASGRTRHLSVGDIYDKALWGTNFPHG